GAPVLGEHDDDVRFALARRAQRNAEILGDEADARDDDLGALELEAADPGASVLAEPRQRRVPQVALAADRARLARDRAFAHVELAAGDDDFRAAEVIGLRALLRGGRGRLAFLPQRGRGETDQRDGQNAEQAVG